VKLAVIAAVVIAFALGLWAGHVDLSADASRRATAANTLILVIDDQPNKAALWKQFRETFAYALERE
jgi:hypothetical protein